MTPSHQTERTRRVVTAREAEINIARIREAFIRKGIPESDIEPGKTVYSFDMWRSLGRIVKRGEHGVHALAFRNFVRLPPQQGTKRIEADVGHTTVFHISQTLPWRSRD